MPESEFSLAQQLAAANARIAKLEKMCYNFDVEAQLTAMSAEIRSQKERADAAERRLDGEREQVTLHKKVIGELDDELQAEKRRADAAEGQMEQWRQALFAIADGLINVHYLGKYDTPLYGLNGWELARAAAQHALTGRVMSENDWSEYKKATARLSPQAEPKENAMNSTTFVPPVGAVVSPDRYVQSMSGEPAQPPAPQQRPFFYTRERDVLPCVYEYSTGDEVCEAMNVRWAERIADALNADADVRELLRGVLDEYADESPSSGLMARIRAFLAQGAGEGSDVP